MFCLVVFILYPLGLGGEIGAPKAALAEGQYLTGAFSTIVGSGWASFVVVCLIGSLFLSMISSTADASRALYGIARDDMTVKQLYHLNRYHVPGRAMTVDMVVNTLLILFISSNVAILYMSNIGYVLCHILALTGFLLLRHDRPNWPRPIKVGSPWVIIAGLLAVANLVFLVYGVANPELAYAVSFKDVYIGFGILVGSVLLYVFRRVVQDKKPVTFRDETPTMPTAEQMRLLEEEIVVGAPQA
jgi:amino acid transporter